MQVQHLRHSRYCWNANAELCPDGQQRLVSDPEDSETIERSRRGAPLGDGAFHPRSPSRFESCSLDPSANAGDSHER
jgi:hypothetical protein